MTLDVNTDELTMLLLEAEDALQRLRLGVVAKVPMGPEHFLSYEKHGADWVLLAHLPGGNVAPLVKASRKLRVLAADSLAALYSALQDEAAKQDKVVVDAIAKARAFIQRVAADSPSEGPK